MTHAWGGVLPPPRGHGYYPPFADTPLIPYGFPVFASTWMREEDLAGVLRGRGWTVEPPAPVERAPFDEEDARERLARLRTEIDNLKGLTA